jgi:hypothetical protein
MQYKFCFTPSPKIDPGPVRMFSTQGPALKKPRMWKKESRERKKCIQFGAEKSQVAIESNSSEIQQSRFIFGFFDVNSYKLLKLFAYKHILFTADVCLELYYLSLQLIFLAKLS